MNLGQYLVSRNWDDCYTLSLETNRWQVTRFNPDVVLPDFYIIDNTGRAQPNPAYYEAHIMRYGVDERKINGNKVGERLPDFNSEIYPWMGRLGIERARQLQDKKDLLYVSSGVVPAADTLIHEMKGTTTQNEELDNLKNHITALDMEIFRLNSRLTNHRDGISGVVSFIVKNLPSGAGGGKYVGVLKTVKSQLESLL